MASISAFAKWAVNGLSKFAGDIRRSLRPRTDADLRLVDDQLAMGRSASWANIYIVPIATVLIAMAVAGKVPLWRVVGWPALMTSLVIGSEIYYRHLLKISDHSPADIARRAQASARLTLLQSIVWCAMGFALWVPNDIGVEALLLVTLVCTVSGWSSMGSFHLASAVAGMPSYLIALVAVPLATGTRGGLIVAALCIGFWLLMRTLMMANYRMRERMIRLEHERSGLVDKLKMAKDESDAARHRAETASRAKSAFLANMSHELRTPLNAILGFSEIIQTKAIGPGAIDQYAEYGGYIHGSGEHLLSLINDILDLAKIESGRMILRETEVDLRSLMDDTLRMMEPRAMAGGITLAIHVDRSFPNVCADERALRQVLVNLASNAVKFTQPGGRVTAFANILSDGSLAFGIDDTGIGIAPEEHDTVFESFGQGRHDAILADKGTGLGLPIVKGLAEAHGGSVMLNSVPSEGTRITVILPPGRARQRLKAAV